jgi:hypothetical protein
MSTPHCLCAVLVMLAAASSAQAQEVSAGRVKVVTGAAFIVRAGQSIAAAPGQDVYEADVLRTGPDGRLGITLNDDTRVSLGAASEVRLDRFSYAAADGAFGLVLKFMRGVGAYVSGRIAKISPDSIRLETPAAIVGVRGTTVAIRVAE